MLELQENVYGHKNRVDWFTNFMSKDDTILEFGCGTAVMVSAYLLQKGYNIYGIDLDQASIDFGREQFLTHGLDPNRLIAGNVQDLLNASFDIILATEVFEHIEKSDIDEIIEMLDQKLKPGGKLIVTVPNGFGWFELESFLWNFVE